MQLCRPKALARAVARATMILRTVLQKEVRSGLGTGSYVGFGWFIRHSMRVE